MSPRRPFDGGPVTDQARWSAAGRTVRRSSSHPLCPRPVAVTQKVHGRQLGVSMLGRWSPLSARCLCRAHRLLGRPVNRSIAFWTDHRVRRRVSDQKVMTSGTELDDAQYEAAGGVIRRSRCGAWVYANVSRSAPRDVPHAVVPGRERDDLTGVDGPEIGEGEDRCDEEQADAQPPGEQRRGDPGETLLRCGPRRRSVGCRR